MIYEKLLNKSAEFMKNLFITDIRIGLGYTLVENSAGGIGLAYTFRNSLPCTCSVFRDAGKMLGKSLKEASSLFLDRENLLNSSVGLAAINSTAAPAKHDVLSGDVLESLNLNKNESVLMIGHFTPIEAQLRKITSNLYVYDDKNDTGNKPPESFINSASCSRVVLITSTTLINKTLNNIISLTPNAETRVLLGPSTPLIPDAFRGEGIDILSGMVFRDKDKIKEIISQGGGTMHFKNYSQKVNMIIKRVKETVI
jgi:uncharacterized protein